MQSMTEAGFWALAPESRNTRSGLFAKIGNSRLSRCGSNPPGPGKTLRKVAVVILLPPTSTSDTRAAPTNALATAPDQPTRLLPGQTPRSASAAPPDAQCPGSS